MSLAERGNVRRGATVKPHRLNLLKKAWTPQYTFLGIVVFNVTSQIAIV